MRQVETLTIDEAQAVFRSYGVPMSYQKLTALIDSGCADWAISAANDTGTYRIIFRKPLIEWLESLATETEEARDD